MGDPVAKPARSSDRRALPALRFCCRYSLRLRLRLYVTPAQAGVQGWNLGRRLSFQRWIPACAGMTWDGRSGRQTGPFVGPAGGARPTFLLPLLAPAASPVVCHPGAGRGPGVECRAEAVFPALDPRLRGDDLGWETWALRIPTVPGAAADPGMTSD